MDQSLFHLINEQWTSRTLDFFMAALSNSEIWKPLFIGIGLGMFLFGGFKARAFVVCLLLSLMMGELFTGVIKSAVDRHRPKQVQTVRMVEMQKTHPQFMSLFKQTTSRFSGQSDRNRSGPSFPSGHVANNTVIAVYCTLFYRRRGWFYWIITAAVGYSRVYLGAHWPSDVIATLFLATGIALFTLGLFELIWKTLGRKSVPALFARHRSLIGYERARSPATAKGTADKPAKGSRHLQ